MTPHASHSFSKGADAAVNAARSKAVVLWLLATTVAAGVAWFGPRISGLSMTLHLMGFILAGVIVGARGIAMRGLTAVTAMLVLGAASFGMWAPRLLAFIDTWLADRLAEITGIDEIASQAATVPISILAAGIMTSVVLFLGTGSAAVVATVFAATVAAAAAPLLPVGSDLSMAISGTFWIAAASTAMCRWAVHMAKRASGACCPTCGYDVRGLTSPVCPHCSEPLVVACPLNTRADRIDQGLTLRRVG